MSPSQRLCAISMACACFGLAPLSAAAQATPKVLKKVPMEFPERALGQGVTKGVLKLRVSVDGDGGVTAVDVVDVQPAKARLLNDTVTTGLKAWRFEAGGKPQSFELQVVLTAD